MASRLRLQSEASTAVSIHSRKPELLIFNQVDRLPEDEAASLARRYQAIPVSALEGTGLRELLTEAERILWDDDDLRPGEEERFVDLAAETG